MRAVIRRGSGIKKAQIQNSQQNEFKRGPGRVYACESRESSRGLRGKDVHSMQEDF